MRFNKEIRSRSTWLIAILVVAISFALFRIRFSRGHLSSPRHANLAKVRERHPKVDPKLYDFLRKFKPDESYGTGPGGQYHRFGFYQSPDVIKKALTKHWKIVKEESGGVYSFTQFRLPNGFNATFAPEAGPESRAPCDVVIFEKP